jgi:hypothetical protein
VRVHMLRAQWRRDHGRQHGGGDCKRRGQCGERERRRDVAANAGGSGVRGRRRNVAASDSALARTGCRTVSQQHRSGCNILSIQPFRRVHPHAPAGDGCGSLRPKRLQGCETDGKVVGPKAELRGRWRPLERSSRFPGIISPPGAASVRVRRPASRRRGGGLAPCCDCRPLADCV